MFQFHKVEDAIITDLLNGDGCTIPYREDKNDVNIILFAKDLQFLFIGEYGDLCFQISDRHNQRLQACICSGDSVSSPIKTHAAGLPSEAPTVNALLLIYLYLFIFISY